jgi:hypothetical protein
MFDLASLSGFAPSNWRGFTMSSRVCSGNYLARGVCHELAYPRYFLPVVLRDVSPVLRVGGHKIIRRAALRECANHAEILIDATGNEALHLACYGGVGGKGLRVPLEHRFELFPREVLIIEDEGLVVG